MDLLILGASARSAAYSALRIGLRPACADLFADLDLASACPTGRVEPGDYPGGLADFADGQPPTPWLYTGAIENRPDLVDRIAIRHPLLGHPGETLRAVRDPIALASAVRRSGLVAPGVRLDPSGLPRDGSWLVKPLASGGGRGIRPWDGSAGSGGRAVYYQERVEGLTLAALFVGEGPGARCLGMTRQFVGRPSGRFAYRGSLGPWPVEEGVRGRSEALGRVVGSAFGLVGLFGIDLVLRDGQVWPIEVNPRYTASVEVLEWASGTSLLREHLRAFGRVVPGAGPGRAEGFVGKAILHADRACRSPMTPIGPIADAGRFPEIADVPWPGTDFRRGEPILTVFARGDSPEGCRRALAVRLRAWRRRIQGEFRPGY